VLEQALTQRTREILNCDLEMQFIATAMTSGEAAGLEICMDGLGRAIDNVFIERLWRSVT
jgi:hypothetical protein